jgi:RNA polymerase sigma-70 factor, ECF subfamily
MNDIEREIANPATRARLLSIARRILVNPEDAEDCLQDALLLASLNAHQYAQRSSAAAWLSRVVINACRMRIRARRRERRGGGHVHVPFHDLTSEPPGGDTPEQLLQTREAIDVIRRELADVAPRDAIIFERAVVEDLPLQALAEETRMTRDAVKARLFRVRRRIAESLNRDGAANLPLSA